MVEVEGTSPALTVAIASIDNDSAPTNFTLQQLASQAGHDIHRFSAQIKNQKKSKMSVPVINSP